MIKNSFNITVNISDNLIREPEILENFEKKLKYAVDLEDYWEVGIKDISMMKSWFLLPVDQKVELVYYDRMKRGFYSIISSNECTVKKGNYSFENLSQVINEKIENYFEKKDDKYLIKQKPNIEISYIPKIYFYENKNRMFQKPGVINESEEFFVRFEPYLSNLIGFQFHQLYEKISRLYNEYNEIEKTNKLPKIDITSDRKLMFSLNPIDRNIIKTIYIFSDLVKPTDFNDNYEHFLQFINIPYDSKFGQQLFFHFENPNYYRLNKNEFSKISFNLIDNIRLNNKLSLITFLEGDLIITLHFRKIIDAIPKIIELEPLNISEDETNLNNPEEHPLQILINNKSPIQVPSIVKTNVIKNSISGNVSKTSITQNEPIVENISVKNKNIPESPVSQNKSNVEQIKITVKKPQPVEKIPENQIFQHKTSVAQVEANVKEPEPVKKFSENPVLKNKSSVQQIEVNGKKPEPLVDEKIENINEPKAKTLNPNETKIDQDKLDVKEDDTDDEEGHIFTDRGSERKTNELKISIKGYMYEEIYNEN